MRFIAALLMFCPLVAATPSFASAPPTVASEPPSLASEMPTAAAESLGVASEPVGVAPEPAAAASEPAAAASEPAAAASEPAAGDKMGASRVSNIDLLLDRAIAQKQIAGGVVVIGNHEGILATAARGTLTDAAGSPALNEHTMFDLASLTKVIATAPAVMKLIDEGRIALSDPVSRYLPEFADGGQITVLNLLTHTSGLDDFNVSKGEAMESVARRAAAERNRLRPGSHFHYADINFILLGELVHRVSGETLDNFCMQQIYRPLGAKETMFLPPREIAGAIAPTAGFQGGTVQDGNARNLGGVAGHAGLFSSAYDLSLYARMLLGSGALQDCSILSQQTFARMTTPYYCNNGTVKRGLGWDMDSPFSAPKGSFFSAASFGHTGYSGSSIWIDPQQDLFVIMLTRRLNYSNTHSFNQLRKNVSTIAAADFRSTGDAGSASAPDVNVLTAQVLQAAYPVIQASAHKARAGASRHRVAQHRRHGRGERVFAKAGGHRGRIRLAKADTGRSGHKKKRLVRS
jgi:CubicO group peptidase (beta-lactamase class C family)